MTNRKKPQGFGNNTDKKAGVFLFIGKDHYHDEWPGCLLLIENMGIMSIDVQGTDVKGLGYDFIVKRDDGPELKGFNGVALEPYAMKGQRIFSADNPHTRIKELKPHLGFVMGMTDDMVRNHVVPSIPELAKGLIKQGVMDPYGRVAA